MIPSLQQKGASLLLWSPCQPAAERALSWLCKWVLFNSFPLSRIPSHFCWWYKSRLQAWPAPLAVTTLISVLTTRAQRQLKQLPRWRPCGTGASAAAAFEMGPYYGSCWLTHSVDGPCAAAVARRKSIRNASWERKQNHLTAATGSVWNPEPPPPGCSRSSSMCAWKSLTWLRWLPGQAAAMFHEKCPALCCCSRHLWAMEPCCSLCVRLRGRLAETALMLGIIIMNGPSNPTYPTHHVPVISIHYNISILLPVHLPVVPDSGGSPALLVYAENWSILWPQETHRESTPTNTSALSSGQWLSENPPSAAGGRPFFSCVLSPQSGWLRRRLESASCSHDVVRPCLCVELCACVISVWREDRSCWCSSTKAVSWKHWWQKQPAACAQPVNTICTLVIEQEPFHYHSVASWIVNVCTPLVYAQPHRRPVYDLLYISLCA